MATHGTINSYDLQDDWATYEERLRHYLIANGVEDAEVNLADCLWNSHLQVAPEPGRGTLN